MERREAIDMSLGGVRIYSDEPFKIRETLKLEIFFAGQSMTFTAEVVWITAFLRASPRSTTSGSSSRNSRTADDAAPHRRARPARVGARAQPEEVITSLA